MKLCALLFTALAAAAMGPAHALTAPMLLGVPDQDHGLRGTARYDRGIYTAFCPRRAPRALTASTSQRHFKLDGCRRISHFSVGY